MTESMLETLHELRSSLRHRWEVLLRSAPVVSPLGYPDALVHMMDWTLDQVYAALQSHVSAFPEGAVLESTRSSFCGCGRNPLVVYFITAECAFMEVAVPLVKPPEQLCSLQEIKTVLRQIARQEIENFCAVCQHGKNQPEQRLASPTPLTESDDEIFAPPLTSESAR